MKKQIRDSSLFKKKINYAFLLVLFLFILIISVSFSSTYLFIVQITLLLVTFELTKNDDKFNIKNITIIYIISFIFLLLVYLGLLSKYGNPYYNGGSDDLRFENTARVLFTRNLLFMNEYYGSLIDKTDTLPIFYSYLAIIMKIGTLFSGYHTIVPRVLNIFLSIWTGLFLKKILIREFNFSSTDAYWTGIIFILFPNTLFINSFIFRDTFNLFNIMLLIYLFSKLDKKKIFQSIIHLLFILLLLYVAYFTRKNSIIFALGCGFFILFSHFKHKKFSSIVIFLLAIFFMNYFINSIKLDYFINTYSMYLNVMSESGLSKFIFGIKLLPFGIILRFFYGLLSPFPNFADIFSNFRFLQFDIVTFFINIGVILQIIFLPKLFKSLIKLDTLSIIFLFLYLGVISTTFTFRHVLLYYPFFFANFVRGFHTTKNKNQGFLFLFWIISITCAFFFYIVLKVF